MLFCHLLIFMAAITLSLSAAQAQDLRPLPITELSAAVQLCDSDEVEALLDGKRFRKRRDRIPFTQEEIWNDQAFHKTFKLAVSLECSSLVQTIIQRSANYRSLLLGSFRDLFELQAWKSAAEIPYSKVDWFFKNGVDLRHYDKCLLENAKYVLKKASAKQSSIETHLSPDELQSYLQFLKSKGYGLFEQCNVDIAGVLESSEFHPTPIQIERLRVFIRAGMPHSKLKSREEESIIRKAVKKTDSAELVRLLVEAGADPQGNPKRVTQREEWHIRSYGQNMFRGIYSTYQTPLAIALHDGKAEIVDYLRSIGAKELDPQNDPDAIYIGHFSKSKNETNTPYIAYATFADLTPLTYSEAANRCKGLKGLKVYPDSEELKFTLPTSSQLEIIEANRLPRNDPSFLYPGLFWILNDESVSLRKAETLTADYRPYFPELADTISRTQYSDLQTTFRERVLNEELGPSPTCQRLVHSQASNPYRWSCQAGAEARLRSFCVEDKTHFSTVSVLSEKRGKRIYSSIYNKYELCRAQIQSPVFVSKVEQAFAVDLQKFVASERLCLDGFDPAQTRFSHDFSCERWVGDGFIVNVRTKAFNKSCKGQGGDRFFSESL